LARSEPGVDLVIDLVPPPVKDMAIRLFGTRDKIALLAGILLVALGYAAAVGVLAHWKGVNVGRLESGFPVCSEPERQWPVGRA
jgi:hypothetical protein